MTHSLALIVLVGLLANFIFSKMKIPGILGMLIAGMIIGPNGLNLLSGSILAISADLRQLALIVILLSAGLDLKKEEIKPVGITALKMSAIPALCEGFAIAFISQYLLGFSFVEGAMLGFVLAAVSPAVVVPAMMELKRQNLKYANRVASLILAGASADDVVAITVFSAFLSIYIGEKVSIIMTILNVPIAIIMGILIAIIAAIIVMFLFKTFNIGTTQKTLILLFFGVGLTTVQMLLEGKIEVAALIGVMALGFILREKMSDTADKLLANFNNIWIFAKILLFVLVGAAVDVKVMTNAGIVGILVIAFGLVARSIGVFIATLGSPLTKKERLFCVIAYIPKATVQAAMGGVPLMNGVASGQLILAIAVMSIILCAPIGAIGIKVTAPKLLNG